MLWLPIVMFAFAIASRSPRERRPMLPILAFVFLLPAAGAHADSYADGEGLYHLGVGIGASMVDPEGVSNGWQTVGDTSDGFKLRLGYRFLPQLYAEASYVDAGEAEIGNLNPTITDVAAIDYRIGTLWVGYTLRAPVETWNVHLKLGISEIRNTSNDDRIAFDEQTSAQLATGIAVYWNVLPRWFLALEHDQYDRDASFTSLSIGWRFDTDM